MQLEGSSKTHCVEKICFNGEVLVTLFNGLFTSETRVFLLKGVIGWNEIGRFATRSVTHTTSQSGTTWNNSLKFYVVKYILLFLKVQRRYLHGLGFHVAPVIGRLGIAIVEANHHAYLYISEYTSLCVPDSLKFMTCNAYLLHDHHTCNASYKATVTAHLVSSFY